MCIIKLIMILDLFHVESLLALNKLSSLFKNEIKMIVKKLLIQNYCVFIITIFIQINVRKLNA